MQVVYARCWGLDVHQQSVVACVLLSAPDGQVRRAVRSFGTRTADLLALNDWLNLLGVEQVAMESTGVYTPAGLHPVGGRPRDHPGQCPTPEDRSGAQDGCEGVLGGSPTSCVTACLQPASSRLSRSARCVS
jgi:hypothetical protein